jgi:hypothetical protein
MHFYGSGNNFPGKIICLTFEEKKKSDAIIHFLFAHLPF